LPLQFSGETIPQVLDLRSTIRFGTAFSPVLAIGAVDFAYKLKHAR
jgi:hypothetical protein